MALPYNDVPLYEDVLLDEVQEDQPMEQTKETYHFNNLDELDAYLQDKKMQKLHSEEIVPSSSFTPPPPLLRLDQVLTCFVQIRNDAFHYLLNSFLSQIDTNHTNSTNSQFNCSGSLWVQVACESLSQESLFHTTNQLDLIESQLREVNEWYINFMKCIVLTIGNIYKHVFRIYMHLGTSVITEMKDIKKRELRDGFRFSVIWPPLIDGYVLWIQTQPLAEESLVQLHACIVACGVDESGEKRLKCLQEHLDRYQMSNKEDVLFWQEQIQQLQHRLNNTDSLVSYYKDNIIELGIKILTESGEEVKRLNALIEKYYVQMQQREQGLLHLKYEIYNTFGLDKRDFFALLDHDAEKLEKMRLCNEKTIHNNFCILLHHYLQDYLRELNTI